LPSAKNFLPTSVRLPKSSIEDSKAMYKEFPTFLRLPNVFNLVFLPSERKSPPTNSKSPKSSTSENSRSRVPPTFLRLPKVVTLES